MVNPQNSDPADGKAPGGEDRGAPGHRDSRVPNLPPPHPCADPWIEGEGRAASRSDHFSQEKAENCLKDPVNRQV